MVLLQARSARLRQTATVAPTLQTLPARRLAEREGAKRCGLDPAGGSTLQAFVRWDYLRTAGAITGLSCDPHRVRLRS